MSLPRVPETDCRSRFRANFSRPVVLPASRGTPAVSVHDVRVSLETMLIITLHVVPRTRLIIAVYFNLLAPDIQSGSNKLHHRCNTGPLIT